MAYVATPFGDRAVRATGWLYLTLFPVPVVLFPGALATDAAYAASEYLQWLHFSQWLIATGLAVGAIAAVVSVVEIVAHPAMRRDAVGQLHQGHGGAELVAHAAHGPFLREAVGPGFGVPEAGEALNVLDHAGLLVVCLFSEEAVVLNGANLRRSDSVLSKRSDW